MYSIELHKVRRDFWILLTGALPRGEVHFAMSYLLARLQYLPHAHLLRILAICKLHGNVDSIMYDIAPCPNMSVNTLNTLRILDPLNWRASRAIAPPIEDLDLIFSDQ
ncbi:hypothetical protein ACMFMG_005439 [Clarireedia jacksonii]